jgi:hypothetical protein
MNLIITAKTLKRHRFKILKMFLSYYRYIPYFKPKVIPNCNITAPNQVVNANSSVLTRTAGDERYTRGKNLYSTAIVSSTNTTTTLSDAIEVSLAANTTYYIEIVFACIFGQFMSPTGGLFCHDFQWLDI